MEFILTSMNIINSILLQKPLCRGVEQRLHDYMIFLEASQRKMPSLKTIQSKMLRDVKKAVHIDNYGSSKDFFFILSIFFERLHSYIVSYNSVKRKRKSDKDIYDSFCNIIFVEQTPCFELTYEMLSLYAPAENINVEENTIDLGIISKEKTFIKFNDNLIRELAPAADNPEAFYGLLSRAYQKFLCFLYNSSCDTSVQKIAKMFNPISMFEFLNYFGYIDSFEILEDIIDPADLEETMADFDLGFKEGEDYILKKICC